MRAIGKPWIERRARAEGWDAIMDMTWFCDAPARGRPCGICARCVYTIEEGLARPRPGAAAHAVVLLPPPRPAAGGAGEVGATSLRDRRADRPATGFADP
jgi:hypothetical protein